MPVECEIWHGFVFVRFKRSEQPSVKEIMAPFESEAALYKAADMVPAYRGFWKSETAVNWKAVRDVDNEGYHVPMAHPGRSEEHTSELQSLMRTSYAVFCLKKKKK